MKLHSLLLLLGFLGLVSAGVECRKCCQANAIGMPECTRKMKGETHCWCKSSQHLLHCT
jgi:hypothetical protein